MLGCPPTSTTSIPCHSTISTTWPLPGCTTSLETMPQHKWWELCSFTRGGRNELPRLWRLNSCRLILSSRHWCSSLWPVALQVVHEIRNYPYPQLHLLALQSLNPSRHASAVRESYEVLLLVPPTSPAWFIVVVCSERFSRELSVFSCPPKDKLFAF